MRTLALFGLIGLEALLAGCGGAAPVKEAAKAAASAAQNTCERRHPGTGAARLDDTRQSSAVALARLGATPLAYAADEDARALHTIDIDRKLEIASTPLAGAPAQVLVM